MKSIKDRIEIIIGDITQIDTEAIVNAANKSLMGGGGVDGAIHRAAGQMLKEECRRLGGCETGEAKITNGYNLKAKYVIHTVGPVYRDGRHNEPELLRNCYENSLKLAIENNIKTIAFPSISKGAYGYPIKEAAPIAIKTVVDFLNRHSEIEKVIFVLFSQTDFDTYKRVLSEYI